MANNSWIKSSKLVSLTSAQFEKELGQAQKYLESDLKSQLKTLESELKKNNALINKEKKRIQAAKKKIAVTQSLIKKNNSAQNRSRLSQAKRLEKTSNNHLSKFQKLTMALELKIKTAKFSLKRQAAFSKLVKKFGVEWNRKENKQKSDMVRKQRISSQATKKRQKASVQKSTNRSLGKAASSRLSSRRTPSSRSISATVGHL